MNQALAKHPEIDAAERAALRAAARAVDRAETVGNARLVSDVSKVYLECRRAAGLTAGGGEPVGLDPFAAFAAGLSGAGVGHPAN